MTRTSLVDGITPFCFTCANNMRLVCRNAERDGSLRMYVISSSAKRARHPPGFYHTLHNRSFADVLDVGLGVGMSDRIRERGELRVRADRDLPEGCHEVERLVAKRKRKVLTTVVFLHAKLYCKTITRY